MNESSYPEVTSPAIYSSNNNDVYIPDVVELQDYNSANLLSINELNYPETTKYVIAHNDKDIYSFNIVEPQNSFATGQPFIHVFDTEEAARAAYPQAFPELTTEDTPISNIMDPYPGPLPPDFTVQSDNQI
jgi:hypothetical protein